MVHNCESTHAKEKRRYVILRKKKDLAIPNVLKSKKNKSMWMCRQKSKKVIHRFSQTSLPKVSIEMMMRS